VLFEGFKESLPVDLSAHVAPPEIDADMYDYDSDSDLESVSEENESSQSESPPRTRTPDVLQNKGDSYHRIDTILNNLDQVEQSGHHQQNGRMIVMKDTAYTTYACLFLVVIVRVLRFFLDWSGGSHSCFTCTPKTLFFRPSSQGLQSR
jgi:hypothetical protein